MGECFIDLLKDYSFLSGWLSFLVALLGVPSIIYALVKNLKEKTPGLNVDVVLNDVFQERVKLSKDEIRDAIKQTDESIAFYRNSLILKDEKLIDLLEESRQIYEANLKSDEELVKLYSVLSFHIVPNLPNDKYRIRSINFEYATMNAWKKLLCKLKLVEKKAGWAFLPEEFRKEFEGRETTQTDPIEIHYKLTKDFSKKFLGQSLSRIYIVDSTKRDWDVPAKEVKKLAKTR